MRKHEIANVWEFHETFGVPARPAGTGLNETPDHEIALRKRLILEEGGETVKALNENDMVEIADGLADTIYVLAGSVVQMGNTPDDVRNAASAKLLQALLNDVAMALEVRDETAINETFCQLEIVVKGIAAQFEIPFDTVFAEVQRSNMSKVWDDGTVKKDEGGKVIKPPTYSPADIVTILEKTGLIEKAA